MEVLTEDESRLVMESMMPTFTRQSVDKYSLTQFSGMGQSVLLIHGPGQEYQLTSNHGIPTLTDDHEILVKEVIAVGLNPIDWKGPDFNFGLPSLPWINGRDLAGVVVKAPKNLRRVRVGDVILSPSTDYRDIRKAAFQQYVITTESTSARVPRDLPIQSSAVIGVAFVAAALALGICLGVNFSTNPDALHGPDLLRLVREQPTSSFADDIREECLAGIDGSERARAGDWVAIWGASSASGLVALQLAKLAKLRTICVVDVARYGERLLDAGADLLVDRQDTSRAVEIIREVTRGRLHYALDTIGRETAETLLQTLSDQSSGTRRSHLVGLAALPKGNRTGVAFHKVPIKAFHDLPSLGEKLMSWLERLLLAKKLVGPEIQVAPGGLGGINKALDDLRQGVTSGKRFVVPLEETSSVIA